MRRLAILCAFVLFALIMISTSGCRQFLPSPTLNNTTTAPIGSTQPQNSLEVQVIQLFKAIPQTTPVATYPGGGLHPPLSPHPDIVQEVFRPGDQMFVGLKFANQPTAPVTFSKYTFFSRETGKEWEIGSLQTGKAVGIPPNDLGPVETQEFFPFFNNPLWVPNEIGKYEIRIYLGNKLVTSAVFEIISP